MLPCLTSDGMCTSDGSNFSLFCTCLQMTRKAPEVLIGVKNKFWRISKSINTESMNNENQSYIKEEYYSIFYLLGFTFEIFYKHLIHDDKHQVYKDL